MKIKLWGMEETGTFTNLFWEAPVIEEEVVPFDLSVSVPVNTVKLAVDAELFRNPTVTNYQDSLAGFCYMLKHELYDGGNISTVAIYDDNNNQIISGSIDKKDGINIDLASCYVQISFATLAGILESEIDNGVIGFINSIEAPYVLQTGETSFADCLTSFLTSFMPGFAMEFPGTIDAQLPFFAPLDWWARTNISSFIVPNPWASRYAFDFSGATVSAALKELCLLAGCSAVISNNKIKFYPSWRPRVIGLWPSPTAILNVFSYAPVASGLTVTKTEITRSDYSISDIQYLTAFRYPQTAPPDEPNYNVRYRRTADADWFNERLTEHITSLQYGYTWHYTAEGFVDSADLWHVGALVRGLDPLKPNAIFTITKTRKDLTNINSGKIYLNIEADLVLDYD